MLGRWCSRAYITAGYLKFPVSLETYTVCDTNWCLYFSDVIQFTDSHNGFLVCGLTQGVQIVLEKQRNCGLRVCVWERERERESFLSGFNFPNQWLLYYPFHNPLSLDSTFLKKQNTSSTKFLIVLHSCDCIWEVYTHFCTNKNL